MEDRGTDESNTKRWQRRRQQGKEKSAVEEDKSAVIGKGVAACS